ncbi:MAG: hypothetical protein WCA85_22030 [Paraburkholderia sp.]|uniref:hypothetical protein n=1 Tax=Paraburkholderia sp. TaxID=1926495 RepID=UPI003C55628D
MDDAPVVYDAEALRRDILTAAVALDQRALSITQKRYAENDVSRSRTQRVAWRREACS